MTVSPSSSPHSPKPLLEERMMLPRSYRAETSIESNLHWQVNREAGQGCYA